MKASALPDRYKIGKTQFYQRRNYLLELGYDLEARKEGRTSFYSPEQIQLLDELDAHIKRQGALEGFPPAIIKNEINSEEAVGNEAAINNGNGLVHANGEQVHIESAQAEEIYVNTNPLEEIKEQQLAAVDTAAQYNAAQLVTGFNYLTLHYMKERNFTVPQLGEAVQESEQAVNKAFVMESPTAATKKMLARVAARST